jgi:hypothetical protein
MRLVHMQREVQLALGNAQNPPYECLRPANVTLLSHSERRHDTKNIISSWERWKSIGAKCIACIKRKFTVYILYLMLAE